jgi:hypothetical protein
MLTDEYRAADWRCPSCSENNFKGERFCFFCRHDAETVEIERCETCGQSVNLSDAVLRYVKDATLR